MNTQQPQIPPHAKRRNVLPWTLVALLIIAVFITGTLRNSQFWIGANVRGDILMREHRYKEAARTYTDPARIAAAQYRDGQFEAAAHTYARVPGAIGAYNQANAWLMRGKYDDAVTYYDRALKIRPGWVEAKDNRAIALARKALLDASSKDREDESAGAYKPDEIAFDQKGDNKNSKPIEMTEENLTDDQLRSVWLRHVQTTPGDFLRFKFAYQATKESAHE